MTTEVTVQLPLHLTALDLAAVRRDDLCKVESKDEMNMRIGWLICAYDAIVASRTGAQQ